MLALRCQTTHINLLYPQSRANSTGDERLLHSSSFNSSSNNTFVRSHERYESMSRIHAPTTGYDLTLSKSQKRISATSSTFPVPPSNIAMVMEEEPGATSRSVSPTTANFSATEMTSSPGSLCLRPELEIHLGI